MLTTHGRRILLLAFIGQLALISVVFFIGKPLIESRIFRPDLRQFKQSIERYFLQIDKQSPQDIAAFLKTHQRPWFKAKLSSQAHFPTIDIARFHQALHHPHFFQPKRWSLILGSGRFIDIMIENAPTDKRGATIAMSLLALIGAILLLALNLWSIRSLDSPLQQLIEHLDYVAGQKQWQALPLVGNHEQRDIFNKINQIQIKLKALVDDRTRILAAISHDLRTPLTRLKLRMEYLDDSTHLSKMQTDVDEMEQMITASLDYFRETSQQQPWQQVDLTSLIEALIADFEDLGIAITTELTTQHCVVNGQWHLLKRALHNIINNAAHYGDQVFVSLKRENQRALIIVRDDGPGIPVDQWENVFQPFYRLESSRSRHTGGSGLGLTIAKEVIDSHQGCLTLANHQPHGLVVTILLDLTH